MSIVDLIILSIGLGMDAGAVAIVKGMCVKNNLYSSIVVSCYFASFQLIMPIIGYYFGSLFSSVSFIVILFLFYYLYYLV